MRRGATIAALAAFLALGALTGAPWGGTIQAACAAGDSGVPYPAITRGKGESCVAETDFMRRNHMNLLAHQRDATMRRGIRTMRFSLKECVACHAVPGPEGTPVGAFESQVEAIEPTPPCAVEHDREDRSDCDCKRCPHCCERWHQPPAVLCDECTEWMQREMNLDTPPVGG